MIIRDGTVRETATCGCRRTNSAMAVANVEEDMKAGIDTRSAPTGSNDNAFISFKPLSAQRNISATRA
jgi:hypothetical protein